MKNYIDKESGEEFPPMEINTPARRAEHTPTRCKSCKWIDEADSVKGTSFRGVELCSVHNCAVNSHEALLTIARAYRNHLKTAAHTEGELATYHYINEIIKQAEGK